MKVAIANFSKPIPRSLDFRAYWDHHIKPPRGKRLSLFEYKADWGFHIYALGVYLMDQGIADEVEFWDFSEQRSTLYHPYGVLQVTFYNERDVKAYCFGMDCQTCMFNTEASPANPSYVT